MIIIYRKSNGQPLFIEEPSSFFVKERYDTSHNYDHVVANHGGKTSDYDHIWIDDPKVAQKIYTHEFTVENGEIVFGDEKVYEESPLEPSPVEILQEDLNAVAEQTAQNTEDISTVGETTGHTLEDVVALGEALALALEKIAFLEEEIAQLKGE